MSEISGKDLISAVMDLYCIGDIDINIKNSKNEITEKFGPIFERLGIKNYEELIDKKEFCKTLRLIKTTKTIPEDELKKISAEELKKVRAAGLNNGQIAELISMAQEMKGKGLTSQEILKNIYFYLKNSNIITLVELYNVYNSIAILLSLFGLTSYASAGLFSFKTLAGIGFSFYNNKVKSDKIKNREEGVRFVPKGTTGKILSYLTIKSEDYYDKIFIDKEVPEELLQYLDDKKVKYSILSFGNNVSKEDAYNAYFLLKHLERKKMIDFKGNWIENKQKLNYFDIPRLILDKDDTKKFNEYSNGDVLNPHRMISFLRHKNPDEFEQIKGEEKNFDEIKNYDDILSYVYVNVDNFNQDTIKKAYEYMTGDMELLDHNFSYGKNFEIKSDKKNKNSETFAMLYMVKKFKKTD